MIGVFLSVDPPLVIKDGSPPEFMLLWISGDLNPEIHEGKNDPSLQFAGFLNFSDGSAEGEELHRENVCFS